MSDLCDEGMMRDKAGRKGEKHLNSILSKTGHH